MERFPKGNLFASNHINIFKLNNVKTLMEKENDNENHMIMKQRAEFFYTNKQAVHIILKSNRFYNGQILNVRSDFLIILDRRLGEMPCFFLEIKAIEPFTESNEGKNETNIY